MAAEEPAREEVPGTPGGQHWSRARAGLHPEAIGYYRERSKAPGVAEGGAERNFYCMHCDGVIPHDHAAGACPHCGRPIEGRSRRYFNWVEINEPVRSDVRALLPLAAGGALLLLVVAGLVVWLLS